MHPGGLERCFMPQQGATAVNLCERGDQYVRTSFVLLGERST